MFHPDEPDEQGFYLTGISIDFRGVLGWKRKWTEQDLADVVTRHYFVGLHHRRHFPGCEELKFFLEG